MIENDNNMYSDFVKSMKELENEIPILRHAITSAFGQILYLKYLSKFRHNENSNIVSVPKLSLVSDILQEQEFVINLPEFVVDGIIDHPYMRMIKYKSSFDKITSNKDYFKLETLARIAPTLPQAITNQFASKLNLLDRSTNFHEDAELEDGSSLKLIDSDYVYIIEHIVSEMILMFTDVSKDVKNVSNNKENVIMDNSIYVLRNIANPYPLYINDKISENGYLRDLIGFVASTPFTLGHAGVRTFTTSPLNKLGLITIL